MHNILFATFVAISLFNVSPILAESEETTSEVQKEIDTIEDPELREKVKEKIAEKMANDILQKTNDNRSDNADATDFNENEKPPEFTRDELGLIIGIESSAMVLSVETYTYTLTGTSAFIGLHKYIGQIHFRAGLSYTSLDLDEVDAGSDGVYTTSQLGLSKYEYSAPGFFASISAVATKHFEIGGYASYTTGELELCASNSNTYLSGCYAEDASSFEIGGRADFLLSAWNPYIKLSYVAVTDNTDTYSGVVASIGLLTFQI